MNLRQFLSANSPFHNFLIAKFDILNRQCMMMDISNQYLRLTMLRLENILLSPPNRYTLLSKFFSRQQIRTCIIFILMWFIALGFLILLKVVQSDFSGFHLTARMCFISIDHFQIDIPN